MDIEKRIYQLATDVFGLNFEEYSSSTGRELYGVIINPNKRVFEPLFGDVTDDFLSVINQQFHDTVAGYRVDVGGHFSQLNVSADVFLLNVNNLSNSNNELDALIIHELCHMIIDSGSLNKTSIATTEKDKYHGSKLYNKTDRTNESTTRHTIQFCMLLSAASEIASSKCKLFKDRWDCINSAMRYDLKGNLRH